MFSSTLAVLRGGGGQPKPNVNIIVQLSDQPPHQVVLWFLLNYHVKDVCYI